MNTKQINMPENITQEFLNMIKLPSMHGKRLRYLMVMPCIATGPKNAYRMPYGFCLVSSALKASGRYVLTLNLNYKTDPYSLLRETILGNNIDVVFTGGLSGQYSIIKKILDTVKSVNPHIITCVGGGIITAEPAIAMKALETADYGLVGEGEITINEIAYALENNEDIKQVPGIVTKQGVLGPIGKTVPNLDILPFPDYDSFEMDSLLREDIVHFRVSFSDEGVPITIGRSCMYNCTFCFHSSGTKYRKRSFENIKKELDWILNKFPKTNFIQFFDEMFSKDIEFLKQLCSYMKEHNLKYKIFQRVDLVTKEMLEIFRDSGCQQVFFGVESADDRILRSMRKNITVKQIENAFNLALEVGIKARGNIIFGDIEETPETIKNTLTWWQNHPKYNITTAWIFTFPGSYLYKFASQQGIIKDKIQYLKNGDMQINVTKMSDTVYWDMVQKVSLFQMLSSNGMNIDFDKMDNIILKLQNTLNKLPEKHKIAIWPAKFDTIAMLNKISPRFIQSQNVFFVNIDPSSSYVISSKRFGKEVFTPEILKKGDIDMVFYALGSRAIGDMVYTQIAEAIKNNYPKVRKLLKITDCLND